MLPTRGIKVLAALAGLAFAQGCGQGEGDRCELDGDCSSELVCVPNPGRTDGQCRPPGSTRPVDAAIADRVNTEVAPAADRGVDLAPADATPDSTPDAGADAGSDGAVDRTNG